MATSLLIWLLSFLGLAGTALWTWLQLRSETVVTARHIHRAAVHQRELLQVIENHRLLKDVQQVSESLVDEGTSVVRSIHKEIASIPFEILESIPTTRDTTRIVRGVHDVTSDGIYAGISAANRMLGRRMRKRMRIRDLEAAAPQDETLAIKPTDSKDETIQ